MLLHEEKRGSHESPFPTIVGLPKHPGFTVCTWVPVQAVDTPCPWVSGVHMSGNQVSCFDLYLIWKRPHSEWRFLESRTRGRTYDSSPSETLYEVIYHHSIHCLARRALRTIENTYRQTLLWQSCRS